MLLCLWEMTPGHWEWYLWNCFYNWRSLETNLTSVTLKMAQLFFYYVTVPKYLHSEYSLQFKDRQGANYNRMFLRVTTGWADSTDTWDSILWGESALFLFGYKVRKREKSKCGVIFMFGLQSSSGASLGDECEPSCWNSEVMTGCCRDRRSVFPREWTFISNFSIDNHTGKRVENLWRQHWNPCLPLQRALLFSPNASTRVSNSK